ncbi:MAG TPA: hypothetical protein GXX51_02610 [Firmicutes bacterium]|nr:hypothetical protein [Bacillota bacterium]
MRCDATQHHAHRGDEGPRVIVDARPITFDHDPELTPGGILLVPAAEFALELGGASKCEPPGPHRGPDAGGEEGFKIFIEARGHLLRMEPGSRVAYIDGREAYLPEAPKLYLKSGEIIAMVPARFVAESLGARVDWDKETGSMIIMFPESGLVTGPVVIDAGHGGHDSGAVGTSLGLLEKDINLDVAKRLVHLMTLAGGKPVATREGDSFVTLKERVELSNSLKGVRAFVSIHCNSHSDKGAAGTETYYYTAAGRAAAGGAPSGKLLALRIQSELVQELGRVDRGVKGAGFYVLRHTRAPAALAELAFISNPDEEELLGKPWSRESAALGLYRGLVAFLNELQHWPSRCPRGRGIRGSPRSLLDAGDHPCEIKDLHPAWGP